ncbi:hypothetical protein SLEP1_g26246 [Rubroshorea leprosula]|uniref:Uncharacterized protein n=1 Tax=Rubroshorea leprosula TaxID=152421 RepID=A0AAV5JVS3_9ROSI|nr:hypothetical protein SLEP1_g26246 [Rubroshorea leprosula]
MGLMAGNNKKVLDCSVTLALGVNFLYYVIEWEFETLAHVDMFTDKTGSFYNPANGIIHWLLLKLTPASGSC